MKDKTCVITGATSGIGRVAAQFLASQGAHLFLLCRNTDKGAKLRDDLATHSNTGHISIVPCDLSSMEHVTAAARNILNTGTRVHVLLNNAGVLNFKRRLTTDGHEEMFAVNYMSHFLLTNLLLDRMKESGPARVVNVGSGAHRMVREIRFDDLTFQKGFRPIRTYAHSKLANGLFNTALASRLDGTRITANVVDPGEVETSLGTQNGIAAKLLQPLLKPFLTTPEIGAETSIYACTAPELDKISGAYLRKGKINKASAWALDKQVANNLWDTSLRLLEL